MASLTSPDWRGFVARAPLPAGSIPAAPTDPNAGRVLRHPAPQAARTAPAVSPASPASRAAAWPPAPSAAFPSWWPAGWPPQPSQPPHASRLEAGATSTPLPHASRLEAGATSAASRLEASIAGKPGGTSRLEAGATSGADRPPPAPQPQARTTPGGPPPPTRPAPAQAQPQPVPPRGSWPLSPRAQHCLEWVVAALPAEQREEVFSALVKTLRFRAGLEQPCSLEGKQPIGRERFGLLGETLVPEGTVRVRAWLDDEVRETLRTLEMRLSRTRRNAYLAMHSARLGQLWRELETRFDIDVLEEVKDALARRWV